MVLAKPMAAVAEVAEFVRCGTGQLRPPLKWAGGKRWLVPYLFEIWQRHNNRRLVEPLCGGLAVVIGLMPKNSLLNDINPRAINFYRWLQQSLRIEIDIYESSTIAVFADKLMSIHCYSREITLQKSKLQL